jgi:hypothetical protein
MKYPTLRCRGTDRHHREAPLGGGLEADDVRDQRARTRDDRSGGEEQRAQPDAGAGDADSGMNDRHSSRGTNCRWVWGRSNPEK